MLAWWAMLLALGVVAQESGPVETLRGTLLERDSSTPGQVSVRTPEHQVYCFLVDEATQIEREGRRIMIGETKPGDALEIVWEQRPGGKQRYARTVRVVLARPAAASPAYPWRSSLRRSFSDELFPRGLLTFAGTVAELNQESLVLRTRGDSPKTIWLRNDTRYLCDGRLVGLPVLKVNTRIFIRGSENLEGEIEAYQVVWGQILKPSN